MLHFRCLIEASVNTCNLQMRKSFLSFFYKTIHTLVINMVAEISGDNKDLAAASCKYTQKTCCCTAALAVIHSHETCSSSSNNIRVESYYRNIFLFNKRIQLLADSLTVHRHHCKAANPFFFQLFCHAFFADLVHLIQNDKDGIVAFFRETAACCHGF